MIGKQRVKRYCRDFCAAYFSGCLLPLTTPEQHKQFIVLFMENKISRYTSCPTGTSAVSILCLLQEVLLVSSQYLLIHNYCLWDPTSLQCFDWSTCLWLTVHPLCLLSLEVWLCYSLYYRTAPCESSLSLNPNSLNCLPYIVAVLHVHI